MLPIKPQNQKTYYLILKTNELQKGKLPQQLNSKDKNNFKNVL